jgi:hypothetical protein
VIGRAIEADDLLEVLVGLGAIDELIHEPGVAQRQGHFGLVDDLAQFAGAQHRHGIDDYGAGFGRRQPTRHQSRIVGRADQNAVARLDAEVLDQRVRNAIGPVGQFLVGAAAAVTDQRDMIAEAARHHAVGELDTGIELLGIVEAGEQNIRPFLRRRQIISRERIEVGRTAEHWRCQINLPQASVAR